MKSLLVCEKQTLCCSLHVVLNPQLSHSSYAVLNKEPAFCYLSLPAAAREILKNYEHYTNGSHKHLSDTRFMHFIITNVPNGLFQGYQTSLHGLVRAEKACEGLECIIIFPSQANCRMSMGVSLLSM